MKNKSRILALILAAILTVSSFASCSSGTEEAETKSDASAAVNTQEETEAETEEETINIYDEAAAALPKENYNGRTFTTVTRDDYAFEMEADSLTGEVTNDATYNRNLKVEDTYGVKFKTVTVGNWDNVTDSVKASVTAGDHLYDIAGQTNFKVYALVGAHIAGNWIDLPHVDLSRSWWAKLVNETATINGRLFAAAGDIGISSITNAYCIYYNANLAQTNGIDIETLQNSVFDKKWTIDYFDSLVADLYTDANGDGEKDAGDVYGFVVSPGFEGDAWLTGFDQKLVEVNDSGIIEVTFITDKTTSALEKVNHLHWEEQGVYNCGEWNLEYKTMFQNAHGVFTLGTLNDARTTYADMEDEFGIMPFPMWNEEQGAYYTAASDQFTVLAFPIDTPESDYDYLGTILEALAIESERTVRPAFYESALKNRYAMDSNTAKIIDVIIESRYIDFSFQHGNNLQIPYMFRQQIIDNSNDIISTYEKARKAVNKGIEKVAEYYGIEQ